MLLSRPCGSRSQAPETSGTGDRYLGQLAEGDEAVGFLSKGIAVLRRAAESVLSYRLPI